MKKYKSVTSWIKEKFDKNPKYDLQALFAEFNLENNDRPVTLKYFKECYNGLLTTLKETDQKCLFNEYTNDVENEYWESELLKRDKTIQKLRDLNTALRRSSRNALRGANNSSAVLDALIEQLPKIDLKLLGDIATIKSESKSGKKTWGIIFLSDIHANTKVMPNEANNNVYNIDIMSKRLDMLFSKAIEHFKNVGVTHIAVLLGGDLISSVRRDNEKLVQITSMANASYILVDIISQGITRLIKNGFVVNITGIVGNESRIPKDFDMNYLSATENFDWMILIMLNAIWQNIPNVTCTIPENPITQVLPLELNNGSVFRVLLNHGYNTKCCENGDNNVRNSINNVCNDIDLALYGHYHHYLSLNHTCWNGSLMGNNSYSTNLGYITTASQSIVVINDKDDFYTMPINVQDGWDKYDGFNYDHNIARESYLNKEFGYDNRGPEIILR